MGKIDYLFVLVIFISIVGIFTVSGVEIITREDSVTIVNTNGTVDTNASTACSGGTVLLGNTTCAQYFIGNGSAASDFNYNQSLAVPNDSLLLNIGNITDFDFNYNQTAAAGNFDYNQTQLIWNITGTTSIFQRFLDILVGIGTSIPTETLTVIGTLNISNATGTLGLFQNADGMVGIGSSDISHELDVHGHVEIEHTADEDGDHALEIHLDSDGFGDSKALALFYTTGVIVGGEDESVQLVNIDQFLATGGEVTGLQIVSTEGGASVTGMQVGVEIAPIQQFSGTFGNMTSALNNSINVLAAFISTATDVDIFVVNGDTVTIGFTSKFQQIEWILATAASNPGIKPVFYFSTGTNTWSQFVPTDGTNGMHNNGIVIWEDEDIPTWATGLNSEFLIRINRTRVSLGTTPIEDFVQITSASEFFWDKNGFLEILNLSATNEIYINDAEVSIWLYNQTDAATASDFNYNTSLAVPNDSLLLNIDNITNFDFNYNQTAAATAGTGLFDTNGSDVFNSTLIHFGLGTTIPTHLIEVNGTANFTSIFYIQGFILSDFIYNQTNTQFNYNQTNTQFNYNFTLADNFNYNQSLAVPNDSLLLNIDNITNFDFNYNQTAAVAATDFAYNQSLAVPNDSLLLNIDNITAFDFNYNQTLANIFNYNTSLAVPNDSLLLNIDNITNFDFNYNQTAAVAATDFAYNQSLAVPNDSLLLNIGNITAFDFNYNQSIPYDAFNYNFTSPIHPSCSAGDFLTFDGSVITCATPSGGSSPWQVGVNSIFNATDGTNLSLGIVDATFKLNVNGSINITNAESNALIWLNGFLLSDFLYNQTDTKFFYNQTDTQFNYNQSTPYDDFNYNLTIGSGWQRTGTNVFLINSGDLVGIGTSTPRDFLEIFTESSDPDGGLTISSADNFIGAGNNYSLKFRTNDNGAEGVTTGFIKSQAENTGTQWSLLFGTVTNTDVNATEKMRITNLGLVGIATKTPTHELNVVGNVNITGDLHIGGGKISWNGTATVIS